jgi:hypothetical protein
MQCNLRLRRRTAYDFMSDTSLGKTAFGHLSITNQSYAYKSVYPEAVGYYPVALPFQLSNVVFKHKGSFFKNKKWGKGTKKPKASEGEKKTITHTPTKPISNNRYKNQEPTN